MQFVTGQRGRSKAEVKLSIGTVFQSVYLHVFEGGKITHTFYPNRAFLESMLDEATLALAALDSAEEKRKTL